MLDRIKKMHRKWEDYCHRFTVFGNSNPPSFGEFMESIKDPEDCVILDPKKKDYELLDIFSGSDSVQYVGDSWVLEVLDKKTFSSEAGFFISPCVNCKRNIYFGIVDQFSVPDDILCPVCDPYSYKKKTD